MISRIRGTTLLELLVTLLIASVLLLFCCHYHSFTASLSNEADAHRFFRTLAFARSKAIHDNQMVSVCPTLDQVECSHDWSQGYMVFYHSQKTRQVKLLRFEQNSPLTHIQSKNVPLLQFSSDGRCLNRATFTIQARQTFRLVVYDSGRIRLSTS
ncbi:MAG: GspH/FimT family protein [Candidatus Berkiella sp.]